MAKAKFLFDECIGRPHIDRLKQFVEIDGDDAPEISHILEFQEPGVWDEEWIPQVASERWIIITQDLGRKGKSKGNPLPTLCSSLKITHVLLSPRVNRRKSFDKMLTVLSVWRELIELADAPPGSRWMIEPQAGSPDAARGKLIDKTPEPKPPPKGRLFDPESSDD